MTDTYPKFSEEFLSSVPAPLKPFIDKLLGISSPAPTPERALIALLADAQRHVSGALAKPKPRSPTALRRDLQSMASAAQKLAAAAERSGEQGMMALFAASDAVSMGEDFDPYPHVAHLRRIAVWATKAADDLNASPPSFSEGGQGGRPPDFRLRSLVTGLLLSYRFHLGIKPERTVDPGTGLETGLSALFVKGAIGAYAPDRVHIEPRKIDDYLQRARQSLSETEEFLPPRL